MNKTAVIYRYEVPVDDQWHRLNLSGAVLHVDARQVDVVELWAVHSGGPTLTREFRVFGTGQPLEAGLRYIGTAVAGPLVWHPMEQI